MNVNEPNLEVSIPVAPNHLSKAAKQTFSEIAQLLEEMGICTIAESPLLELMSQTYADLRKVETSLKKRGSHTYEVDNKYNGLQVKVYPEVAIISDLRKQMLALLSKCGLTPADRSRVNATKSDDGGDEYGWL